MAHSLSLSFGGIGIPEFCELSSQRWVAPRQLLDRQIVGLVVGQAQMHAGSRSGSLLTPLASLITSETDALFLAPMPKRFRKVVLITNSRSMPRKQARENTVAIRLDQVKLKSSTQSGASPIPCFFDGTQSRAITIPVQSCSLMA